LLCFAVNQRISPCTRQKKTTPVAREALGWQAKAIKIIKHQKAFVDQLVCREDGMDSKMCILSFVGFVHQS